ncbi:Predicted nucleotidyltransferase [Propionispira arboris]|uniref:tRNA(Met) cytidine acetate ligase n=1 Tax=Propionispira arboris TaxID=84035 RepID=A0A1H6VSQ2_9FIRM|nr:nucleotidyltransferase [Propionispira arboris]SEJ07669.1 Predicted nucleotidyltransferase [Propionispira arboris]
MESIGIIAEYNPFHNGHLHQITEAKKKSKLDYTICIMSGNFTQRGEPALFSKWTRAAMAVNSGVDLVIELPCVFTVRSAQDFARGGIRLLNSLNIRYISFGSEHADLSLLEKVSSASLDPAITEELHTNLKSGQSYAAALSTAISKTHSIPAAILSQPNTILAVEYLNAIKIFKTKQKILPIERAAAPYHSGIISGDLASAGAIRKELYSSSPNFSLIKQSVPLETYQTIETFCQNSAALPSMDLLSTSILALLRKIKQPELKNITGISEGLEYKIAKAALQSRDLTELLALTKSKRYPMSRLHRLVLHCLLGTTKQSIAAFDQSGPLYARVLAFNMKGREILHELKRTASIPIITKTTNFLDSTKRSHSQLSLLESMLAIDTYATDLYALCFSPAQIGGLDFLTSPMYIKR